ncbi:hypothetical protein GO491_11730 [Flavobacteriaceae bacterium Ap0902]|nr:hypothetical protein [Flavobacteriaceae bacterium Ap0902]
MGVRKDLDIIDTRYIYYLIDNKTNVVLYVGTAKDPKKRYKTHLRKIKSNNSALIYQYCIKHKIQLKLKVVKKLYGSYADAEKIEIENIIKHKDTVLNFYNNPNKKNYYRIEETLNK